jgi:LacI family transcriptional regulator
MSEERASRGGRRGLTIHDVARAAEVSIGTASKALNGTGALRQETRDKVLAAARQLGYTPNDLAQSLHRARSMTVGLLTNDSFGRFSFPIVEALEQTLADHGIAVFMCNATDDPGREQQHLQQLMRKRIDGLVVTARRADRRPAIAPLPGVPIVYVYSQVDDDDALCFIPDDEGGARLAVDHLVAQGRRRIGHIAGPERFDAVRLRRAGYVASLSVADISYDPALYLNGPWSEQWGRDAVAKLFDGKRPAPDALFCDNDQLARGACEALRERGIKVPEDVAIVGFDNWEVMTLASQPPLSSVDMNLSTLGREAGEALLALMSGRPQHGVRRLPCSLVVRESSMTRQAPPPAEKELK